MMDTNQRQSAQISVISVPKKRSKKGRIKVRQFSKYSPDARNS